METPICDFVRRYAEQQTVRLHMPGHKGRSLLGCEALDITEIDGADVLYHAQGIIRESEAHAAELFGSAATLYSAEGSSLAIRAMLYLAVRYAKERGETPHVAAGRNAHKTFLSAAALLDVSVSWLFGEGDETLLSCLITPSYLAQWLDGCADKPTAVYVTSPDYLGNSLNLRGLAEVCHARQILLLVDNAHGAYLHFLPTPLHPMDLGADACCDSAHKTLPALTGGAYLHLSHAAPPQFADGAEQAMALFASTSPSYLILQSLDAVNRYLAADYPARLAAFCQQADALKLRLRDKGFCLVGTEPLKLTIAPKAWGYTGTEMAEELQKRGVICEFYDADFITMMLTPELSSADLQRVEEGICSLVRRRAVETLPPIPKPAARAVSIREAMLAPSEELPLRQCRGRILASAHVACPPAIPIAICGERLDDTAIACMNYYGVETCRVIKESS